MCPPDAPCVCRQLGRYWPRDEKKRQLERARERKQKQQQRTKMAALPEEAAHEETTAAKRQVSGTDVCFSFIPVFRFSSSSHPFL